MGNKLTNEQFLQKLKDLGRDDIEPLEEYKGSNKKILCRCKKHNYEWKVTPDELYRGSGCPKCKSEGVSRAKKKNARTISQRYGGKRKSRSRNNRSIF